VLNEFQLKPENFQQKYGIDVDVNQDESQAFFKFYSDYPLKEEMCLDCFLPIKDYLKNINFKKYLKNNLKMTAKNEMFLRKLRILNLFERLVKQNESISTLYMRQSINHNQSYNFSPVLQQQAVFRKRRQNVAIMALQQKNNTQLPIAPPTSISKQPPIARPQPMAAQQQQSTAFTGFPSFLPTDFTNAIRPQKTQNTQLNLQETQYNEIPRQQTPYPGNFLSRFDLTDLVVVLRFY
jgi:hypothetical protein